ncbi:MAG TPA: 4,5-dihydroxyphthalate decarboxylase [Candidatus Dormibacteraeota bacterium]|jgi:4,5-dihydroxyphthalate decarboxylase|nr:4,5-dihydroxyphthalate decarboxylase [Candidatus Dormibacteraeota bacterium]
MGIAHRPNLHLTLAVNAYDHVRDLVSGVVPVEGVDLTCLHFPVEEIFYRFARYREWDVSEFSLAKYAALRSRGDTSLVAIPVFPSRIFRHSAIFVREDGPVDDPRALAGGRIGIPEWTQTATVWVRGLLQHEYGIGLERVSWVQAGTNQPGRVEGIELRPPPGISLTSIPDRTLNDLLLGGELDAVIAAHPPSEFERGTGRLRRLFTDPQAVEEAYYRRTGIFPIMHVVALRSEVYRRHPWVAMNLLEAFEAAKRRSLERILDTNVPHLPVPWAVAAAERAQRIFGGDPWPYGIEPNLRALETFLGYALEQGVCAGPLEPEELFVPEVRTRFRI